MSYPARAEGLGKCKFGNLWFTSSNWVITPPPQATQNICCAKGESTVDHSTIIWWFKNFAWVARISTIRQSQQGLKPLILRWGRAPNHKGKPASSTLRVSGELGVLQSSVFRHIYDICKSIKSCRTMPHISKILQNRWLTQVWLKWCVRFLGWCLYSLHVSQVYKRAERIHFVKKESELAPYFFFSNWPS